MLEDDRLGMEMDGVQPVVEPGLLFGRCGLLMDTVPIGFMLWMV